MTTKELIEKTGWTMLSGISDKQITSAYVCDLLSWVMSHGEHGTAWITVMTHLNVLAVASLHDFSCVIIPENIAVSDEVISVANEKGVCLISTPSTAYGAAIKLAELDVSDI